MFNPMGAYMPLRAIAPIAKKGINWAGLLSNTQKTLNIVNQAIPIVYQVKPILNNAKTMFKLASAFSSSSNNSNINNNTNNTNNINTSPTEIEENNTFNDLSSNQPSFFI